MQKVKKKTMIFTIPSTIFIIAATTQAVLAGHLRSSVDVVDRDSNNDEQSHQLQGMILRMKKEAPNERFVEYDENDSDASSLIGKKQVTREKYEGMNMPHEEGGSMHAGYHVHSKEEAFESTDKPTFPSIVESVVALNAAESTGEVSEENDREAMIIGGGTAAANEFPYFGTLCLVRWVNGLFIFLICSFASSNHPRVKSIWVHVGVR